MTLPSHSTRGPRPEWPGRWKFYGSRDDGFTYYQGVDTPPEHTWVVPCDDDAIERVAERLYYIDDERVRVEGVEWVNEPDGYKGLYRDRAREVFDAAKGK